METIAFGNGLYLKPPKVGFGLHLKKKWDPIKLPQRALNNVDILTGPTCVKSCKKQCINY